MSHATDQTINDVRRTVNDYVAVLRRRWRTALLTVSAVAAAAFWYSQYLPRQYVATTVFERRDDVVLANLIQSNSPYSFAALNSSLTLDMTGSRALAAAAVSAGLVPAEKIAGTGALTDAERAAVESALSQYALKASLKVLSSTPNCDVVELSCTGNDPKIARTFVGALRDQYVTRTGERISEVLERTKTFFQTELTRYQAEVAKVQEGLQHGFGEFPGVDPTDLGSVGGRLETLRAERDRLFQQQAALEAEIAARENFVRNVPEDAVTVPTGAAPRTAVPTIAPPATLQAAIDQVQAQLVELRTVKRMTAEHPDVKALQFKLEALLAARDEIVGLTPPSDTGATPSAPTVSAAASPYWRAQQYRVEMELEALRKQQAIIGRDMQTADGRVKTLASLYSQLTTDADKLRRAKEQIDADTQSVTLWRQHLAQLDRVLTAQSEQRGTQFALIEEPKSNPRPISPRLTAILLECLGLGLAAALLVVALAELFDRSYRSVSQVARSLGVPVLECIGVVDTPRERWRRLKSRLVWAPALSLALLCLVTAGSLAYISLQDPELNRRAVGRLDRAFQSWGGPVTHLAGSAPR
jgi:uncharacterized protein involved in exopolysaccharide biosynthesis